MKKIIFTLIVVIAMGISAVAQDGFFRSDNGGGSRTGEPAGDGLSVITPGLPGEGVGASNSDKPAPLGSGLLVLTALGAGYALSRKREK